MVDFTFTSPEGKNYTVTGPEGATKEQAFGILQQRLKGGQQPDAAPSSDKAPSLAEAITTGSQVAALSAPSVLPTAASVAQGVLNLPEGALQAAGVNLPKPLEAVRQEAQKAPVPALGEMAGEAAAPWNWFFPEARLGTLARTLLSGVRGGISSLFTPQKDAEHFWDDAAQRTAIGAGIGAPLGAISGPAARDAQHLLDNNIRVTPSTMVGARGAERLVTKLPGFGEAVEHGADVTIGDYNRRLYRWVLDGLGVTQRDVPLQAGSGGLSYVFNQITQRLNRANAALELTPYATPGFARDFLQAFQNARATMSPDAFRQFNAALQNNFVQPVMNANGRLDGAALAKAISDFTGFARDRMRGNFSPDDVALARSFRDVVDVMNQYSTGPQWARDLRDAGRTAYAKYMTLEGAAGRAGVGAEGVITPRSFLASQQAQIGRARFQRDEIPFADSQAMKDLSETVNRVVGPRGGGISRPLIGVGALAGGGLPLLGHTLPGLAAWWAAHSGPGMTAASQLAQSPTRAALPRLTGPLAAIAAAGGGDDDSGQ